MIRLALIAACLVATPVAGNACPVAGKSYTIKHQNWLKTKMYFNEDCTEAVQNYNGAITRHKMTRANRGWTFQNSNLYKWHLSETGRSIRLIGPEWSVQMNVVRNKTQ